jgi:hypothetical protein
MSEEKKQMPNQHLADKIAGKVDEKGNPIEQKDSVENNESKTPTHIDNIPVETEEDNESEEV